ncbi:hypothetical protein PAHAL_2G453100 [Panicum hallii]|uniref:DUF2415 domain-containing protein n=1 Tax=Panicum hallii TaxID=206008 RepID=A0A2T8KT02_9POAL|nr:hypothetical protein PAHAL_2G453100 [Panicum hallii]
MASRRAGRTGDARRRLELRVAPTHPHRWRAAPETTRRTAGPSRPRRTATDMTETAPVVTPPTSIINAVRTPTLLSRASTAAPAVSAFPAAEPLVPIRFESASLSRASHRNSGSLHPRISRATTASANPNQFIRRVPETMDMDLVDDLELLDDYDDLEFDRFGVAAGDTSRQECKQVDKKGTFYDFCFNTRLARSTVVHFQLRDLVWATSKHDVYMAQNYSVMHWSSLLQKGEEVLNAIDNVFPKQKVQGARPLFRMQTCSMAVRDNFMVAGGFRGELVCKYVDQPGVAFCTSVAEDDDNITNTVDLYESPNGSTRVIAGNNDCVVRVFDTERFRLLSHFAFPWSVNDTSVSPDGKLVAVLGDSSDCLIADLQSGKSAGNREPQGALGLLVLVGVAPRRARPRHREPGHHLPAVGRPQPLAVPGGAEGADRRRPGPQVLVGRPLPGGGGGRGLRPRVRRARRLLEGAGDRHLRGGRGRVVQPGRGGPVRRRRGPHIRQPHRVPQEASLRILGLLSMRLCT